MSPYPQVKTRALICFFTTKMKVENIIILYAADHGGHAGLQDYDAILQEQKKNLIPLKNDKNLTCVVCI